MIKYLKHNEIDKAKWDNSLKLSLNASVYASSWYLDIVSPEWEAIIEGDYTSIFPLCVRKKFGFDYLYQPFFTQQGGLFSSDIEKDKLLHFLKSIPSKFRLIEINLNTSNQIEEFEKFRIYKRKTHHLELNSSMDSLRKKYSENLIRNLKKAKKVDQIVNSGNEIKAIISIFRNERGKNIGQLKDKDYLLLEEIVDQGIKRNLVEVFFTRDGEGKINSGAVFLKSFDSYIFLFSATDKSAREFSSMALLIDHFIENHQQENKLLDFEGSMDEHLSRYYRSFGSLEIVYLQIRKNTLPIPIRWFK